MQWFDAITALTVGLLLGSLIVCIAFRVAVRIWFREKRAHLREMLGASDKE